MPENLGLRNGGKAWHMSKEKEVMVDFPHYTEKKKVRWDNGAIIFLSAKLFWLRNIQYLDGVSKEQFGSLEIRDKSIQKSGRFKYISYYTHS